MNTANVRVMSPAQVVIEAFGGVRATATAIGRSPGAVSAWTRPVAEGGTGGRVPSPLLVTILDIARRAKLPISEHDLIHGRVVRN